MVSGEVPAFILKFEGVVATAVPLSRAASLWLIHSLSVAFASSAPVSTSPLEVLIVPV